jgi:hypothetical protein
MITWNDLLDQQLSEYHKKKTHLMCKPLDIKISRIIKELFVKLQPRSKVQKVRKYKN